MKCKNLKIRTKKGIKYGYCSLYKKEVQIFNCKCNNIEYKQTMSKTIKKVSKIKKTKSYKIKKLENNRFSILTDNLNVCYVCGKPKQELHEVYEGIYRNRSMQYGCVLPLCKEHHDLIHKDKQFKLYYKRLMELQFNNTYKELNFNDIFFYKK